MHQARPEHRTERHAAVLLASQAFPPMGPYAGALTQKLAGIFGLRSSQQGSGRKRFVIVASTAHTHIPYEPCERDYLAQLLASQADANAALQPGAKPGDPGRGGAFHEPSPPLAFRSACLLTCRLFSILVMSALLPSFRPWPAALWQAPLCCAECRVKKRGLHDKES